MTSYFLSFKNRYRRIHNSLLETEWSPQAVKMIFTSFYFLKKFSKSQILGLSDPEIKTRARTVSPADEETFRSPQGVFQDISGPRWDKNNTVKSAFSVIQHVQWPWIVKQLLKEFWLTNFCQKNHERRKFWRLLHQVSFFLIFQQL